VILSYLTLGLRHLIRHRFYAFLNVTGLAIGFGQSDDAGEIIVQGALGM